jgi:hypothetical protein
MKVTLRALRRKSLDRLVIESVDLSLYIAHAEIDGQRLLIVGDDGRPLRTANLMGMKERLAGLNAGERVLLQRSAYDEMVGQACQGGDNSLEIRLGPGYETLPPWQH